VGSVYEKMNDNDGASLSVIVPCFNEATRLSISDFRNALDSYFFLYLTFVDDGSSDNTSEILTSEFHDHHRVQILSLPRNRGKGEAVRLGLLHSLASQHQFAGFLDADLSTSIGEIVRLGSILKSSNYQAVIGSRVSLMGHRVTRSFGRHYLGRVFATMTTLITKVDAYDTQCGAKVFRLDKQFESLISKPFISRWCFDIELLIRLGQIRPNCVLEEPLREWFTHGGSTLTLLGKASSLVDLLRIKRHYKR